MNSWDFLLRLSARTLSYLGALGHLPERGLDMHILQREIDGVTLVDISGRIDSSVSGQVMDKLNGILNSGVTKLIVNLKEVNYISSAGLRSILVAAKFVKSSNGEMRLCEPKNLVKTILEESGFANLIRIDDYESQSVAALRER